MEGVKRAETSSAIATVVVAFLLAGFSPLGAQVRAPARCFLLQVEAPEVLFMLQREVQGELLVLTDEPLRDSPGVTDGSRAYLGSEEWREQAPLQASSWYWSMVGQDSVRVGPVLPLWSIIWTARETSTGLEGIVTYTSDEVGTAPRTSPFIGAPSSCPAESQAGLRSTTVSLSIEPETWRYQVAPWSPQRGVTVGRKSRETVPAYNSRLPAPRLRRSVPTGPGRAGEGGGNAAVERSVP